MSVLSIQAPTDESIRDAANLLRKGQLVAFPTETVYGLGGDARSADAVRRIFAAKERPADHPLIVHIGDVTQLRDWATDIPAGAEKLANALWPGPLTLILKRAPQVIDEVTGGQATIGLRIPSHPVALALLQAFGSGIAAPSANRFGQISPTQALHVADGLGERVSLILDGGPCRIGIESSIVDLTGIHPRLLRPGMLKRSTIESVLGADFDVDKQDGPRVSGSLASHYAPRTPASWLSDVAILEVLSNSGDASSTGVIALGKQPAGAPKVQVWRNLSANPDAYAQELYAALRELDELNLTRILLEIPPDSGDWEAIRDRLRRAAGSPEDMSVRG